MTQLFSRRKGGNCTQTTRPCVANTHRKNGSISLPFQHWEILPCTHLPSHSRPHCVKTPAHTVHHALCSPFLQGTWFPLSLRNTSQKTKSLPCHPDGAAPTHRYKVLLKLTTELSPTVTASNVDWHFGACFLCAWEHLCQNTNKQWEKSGPCRHRGWTVLLRQ